MLEQISNRVEENAPCCDGEAPEVEALSPLEGCEDLDVELSEVVDGYAEEDDYNELQ